MKMSEKKYRVRATNAYQKKQLADKGLKEKGDATPPVEGQEWEVDEKRLAQLKAAEKQFGMPFVKVIEVITEEEKAEEENKKEPEEAKVETAVKKVTRKRNAKK